jgi:hypothetical protein
MPDSAQLQRVTESGVVPAARSAFERVSSDHFAMQEQRRMLEHRSFWSRLGGSETLVERSDADAAQCKLACLIAWMHSQRMDVPGRVLMILSPDVAVRAGAADELATERRRRDAAREGHHPAAATPPLDHMAALQLALAECEERTAPVTARSVSSVEDSFYIGYQRRRTLAARLWFTALVSFSIGCALEFVHAWVVYRLKHGLSGAMKSPYPEWTSLVADYVVLPTELLFWGLLGASLYLLRRLYDFTERRTFDHRLTEMYWVRLLMGGVAGAMLSLLLLPPSAASQTAAHSPISDLGSHAIALVGGFSVRAVYALIERASGLLRDQFARPAAPSTRPPRGMSAHEEDT